MTFTKELNDLKFYLTGSILITFIIVYVMNSVHSVSGSSQPTATIAWGYTAPCFQIAGIDMGVCYYWQNGGMFIPINVNGKAFPDSMPVQNSGKDWVKPFVMVKTTAGTYSGIWQFNIIDNNAVAYPAGRGDISINTDAIFGTYTTTYEGDTKYSTDVCGCDTYPANTIISIKLSVYGLD